MLIYIRIRDETNHVLCSLLAPALFTRFDFSAHAVINFPFSIECGTCPSFIYAFNQKAKKKNGEKDNPSLVFNTNRDELLYSADCPAPSLLPAAAIPPRVFVFASFLPSFLTLFITNFWLGKNSFLNIFIDFLYTTQPIKFGKRVSCAWDGML